MKVLSSLLWASTALEACAVSAQALIYTFDPHSPRSKASPASISPSTARLLFAQRLGLSRYHSLEDADEPTLAILNTYGRAPNQMFTHDEKTQGIEKVLIIVDGIFKSEGMNCGCTSNETSADCHNPDILDGSISPAATISPQPSSSHNLQLALDLLEQDQHSRTREHHLCSAQFPSSSLFRGGLSRSGVESDECARWSKLLANDVKDGSRHNQMMTYKSIRETFGYSDYGQTTILHISSLQGLTSKDGTRYTTALSEIKDLVIQILSSQISSTIVLMPTTSGPTKRSINSPYGTYTNPRRQDPEEPLVSPGSAPSTHQPSAPEVNPLQASSSPLPRGIIPACHPTLESAISATNNCSSHGIAYKKFGGEKACYACKCSKTVLTDGEGRTKTVYWGGPACQKKDISVPFFLLAGLSIALVAAATWGVGLLMSVGNEGLPSVIGAGVAGPRAQK